MWVGVSCLSGRAWVRGPCQGKGPVPMLVCGCPEPVVGEGLALGAVVPCPLFTKAPATVMGQEVELLLEQGLAPLELRLGLWLALWLGLGLAPLAWLVEGPLVLLCPLWCTCGAPWMSWATHTLGSRPIPA